MCLPNTGSVPVPIYQQRLNQPVAPRNERSPQNDVGTQPTKPIIRGSGQELPPLNLVKTSLVSLPSPDEVGIRLERSQEPSNSKPVESLPEKPIDWESLLSLLERKGATGHQLDKVGEGYRFVVKLKAEQITGNGRTRNEAVQDVLSKLK